MLISSEKFSNPMLMGLLRVLNGCFTKLGMPYYVIGATARDIILRQMINVQSGRRTLDIDIAIAIDDWSKFDEVADALQNAGLTKASTMCWAMRSLFPSMVSSMSR